jgi:hypothetical protein
MKVKIALPDDLLTASQIRLIERFLAVGLLQIVVNNFPNWTERARERDITGGEIILQQTDLTQPIMGLNDGIHLTISLVSFMPDRNFDGLAEDIIERIKQTPDQSGTLFMQKIAIFAQMSLDRPVTKYPTDSHLKGYHADPNGTNLLEYTD